MLFYLNQCGILKVAGSGASQLLQGQITTDVKQLTEGLTSLSALCNPQGRIMSLFYLFLVDGAYFLLMQKSMVPLTLECLKKYAIFYKVTLENIDNLYCYAGEGSIDGAITLTQNNSDDKLIISKVKLSSTLKMQDEWQAQNLKKLIPTIYPETSGLYLPHEFNLPVLGAISFDKGCYTGQEIIARMHYKGKLKKHLIFAKINSLKPELNSDIYLEEKIIGNIIDFAASGHDEYFILGLVTSEKNLENAYILDKLNDKHYFKLDLQK